MPKFPLSGLSKNHLLNRLPLAEYRRLAPHLKAVHLPVKQSIYPHHARMDYCYFPTTGVVSAMRVMENGNAIEVATLGNEGMTGLSAVFGGDGSPYEVMVQVEADAMRIRANMLKAEASRNGHLKQLLSLYNIALQTQISYSVACNGLHTLDKRCCRWLLMTQDRIDSDVLPLTHEFLSIMLGVRRASVTEVLRPLQKRGLIQSSRGKVRILDRQGLEAISCECYRRTKEEFTRLFG